MKDRNMFERERVEEIASEYMWNISHVMKYLNMLKKYSFIVNGEEELMYDCLEAIVSERCSESKRRSLNETISEMIYRVYGEKALYYLNEEFLESHNIDLYDDRYFDDYLDQTELEYQGWSSSKRR